MKYPSVRVSLSTTDGNAFALMAVVSKGLKRHGVSRGEIEEFQNEAMMGDYDELIQTCLRWVNCS